MILVPHVTVEVLPEASIFPEGSITTARHIAEDSIKLEVLAFTSLLQVWELASIIVCHEEGWQVQLGCLMSEHEGSFTVCVVCDQHTCVHFLLVLVQGFQDLDTFRTRCCAHVQHTVTFCDVQ